MNLGELAIYCAFAAIALVTGYAIGFLRGDKKGEDSGFQSGLRYRDKGHTERLLADAAQLIVVMEAVLRTSEAPHGQFSRALSNWLVSYRVVREGKL